MERYFPFYSKIDKSYDNFIEVKVKTILLDDQNEVLYVSVSQIVPEICPKIGKKKISKILNFVKNYQILVWDLLSKCSIIWRQKFSRPMNFG